MIRKQCSLTPCPGEEDNCLPIWRPRLIWAMYQDYQDPAENNSKISHMAHDVFETSKIVMKFSLCNIDVEVHMINKLVEHFLSLKSMNILHHHSSTNVSYILYEGWGGGQRWFLVSFEEWELKIFFGH